MPTTQDIVQELAFEIVSNACTTAQEHVLRAEVETGWTIPDREINKLNAALGRKATLEELVMLMRLVGRELDALEQARVEGVN